MWYSLPSVRSHCHASFWSVEQSVCVFFYCVCVHKDAVNKGSHLGELAGWPRLWQPSVSAAAKPARLLFLFPTSTSLGDPLVRHIGIKLLAWSLITAAIAEQRGQWERLMALSPTLNCFTHVLGHFISFQRQSTTKPLAETWPLAFCPTLGGWWRKYMAKWGWVQIPSCFKWVFNP